MATSGPERGGPVFLQPADNFADEQMERPPREARSGFGVIAVVAMLSFFWLGAAAAYVWGYFGPGGVTTLNLQQIVLVAFAAVAPPVLLIMTAWAFSRGRALSHAATELAEVTERLFTADESAARTSARLGRAVRRELDALNAGLDGAFTRLRALESVLESQIAAIDEAGARVDVRADAVAARLTQERERIDAVAATLADAATRAGEIVAGRTAQLKASVESAEGTLKAAGTTLDTHAANFRAAANTAAEAPHAAAVELDRQATRIEAVSDAAMARAEFVLGRHERHRAAMGELLQRLKDEGSGFETTLAAQRGMIEQAIAALGAEAEKFAGAAGDAHRGIETLMSNAVERGTQLTASFAREADNLKDISHTADASLAHIVKSLREAGVSIRALIDETASKAQTNAKALVDETTAEYQRLLQVSGNLATEISEIKDTLIKAVAEVEHQLQTLPDQAQTQAGRVREMVVSQTDEINKTLAMAAEELQQRFLVLPDVAQQEAARVREMVRSETDEVSKTLSKVAEELEKHLLALPGVAQQEAARVREMVRNETEEILDLSARTLSTIHSRRAQHRAHPQTGEGPAEGEDGEGLLRLARKLTQRPRRKESGKESSEGKTWEMSQLLAAADHSESKGRDLKPVAAAALGALQAALADMAIDLDVIAGDEGAGDDQWRRYLSGDRSVFARRVAQAIDADAVNRIATLYRENARFRDAANTYLSEFETMLNRAYEGDGGGLLASSLLSADTGKIYLAIAYALGRLA